MQNCGVTAYAEQFVELKPCGSNILSGRCPHPDHNDSTPSFRIFKNKGKYETWCCMGCHSGKHDNENNFGVDNIAFVRWMSHTKSASHTKTFAEAVKELCRFYNIPIQYECVDDNIVQLYKNNAEKALQWHRLLKDKPTVVKYLSSRGLDAIDIKQWLLGYDGHRITFPIFNSSMQVSGFSNRCFDRASTESGIKYINSANSPIFNKREILYGAQFLNKSNKEIIIVEGQMDCILAHKYGLKNVVATMNCHLSDEQAKFIKDNELYPVLCYDSDSAGIKGMQTSIQVLLKAQVQHINILKLPIGKDMADIALEQQYNLVNYKESNTEPYWNFLLSIVAQQYENHISLLNKRILPTINNILQNINSNEEYILAKSYIKNRLHIYFD